MHRVSEYVAEQPADGPPSRNAVEANVTGKRAFVRQAKDALVNDAYLAEADGRRGARQNSPS